MPTYPKTADIVDPELLSIILSRVQKPGRYIGKEANSIHKPESEIKTKICLLFPDMYELGMSNTGLKLLYQIINSTQDCLAERAYTPWPDMGEELLKHGVPFYSMETHRPLKHFDGIGITLQTEFAFSNITYSLKLAGVPVWAKDRTDSDPLIFGGGPSVANPEPVADFFDFFIIGDGESTLPPLLELFVDSDFKAMPRKDKLERLAKIEGMYVPSLHEVYTNEVGEIIPVAARDGKGRAVRSWVKELSNAPYLKPSVVPNLAPTHMRYGVEVMRGCTNGCRYCQAGYWYRPTREMDVPDIMEAITCGVKTTGLNEFGMLSLSTADYSRLEELVRATRSTFIDKMHVSVALPSLRADQFTADLAGELEDMHGNSLTFAPETGSERLRKFINKNITDEQMFEAARTCYARGWNNIKLYFMIGLPSETMEDVAAIPELIQKIADIGRSVGKRKTVSLNIGIFSPKPFTAFQWDARGGGEELEAKMTLLRDKLHTMRVRYFMPDMRYFEFESTLARGDRRLSRVIFRASQMGAKFDGWNETFDWEIWKKAYEKEGIDFDAYGRERPLDAVLPWEVIDMGVSREFFVRERKKADTLALTTDCKWGECSGCGIAKNSEGIRLASDKKFVEPEVVEEHKPTGEYKYRLHYKKHDWARFLSHRDSLTLIEQALRRTGLLFKYTQGFHPRLKMTAGPALPFGYETDFEYLDIVLLEQAPEDWAEKMSGFLPDGMDSSGHYIKDEDFSLCKFSALMTYSFKPGSAVKKQFDINKLLADWQKSESFQAQKKEGKGPVFETKDWIKELRTNEDGSFEFDIYYEHNKAALTLNILLHAFGLSDDDIAACKICRTGFEVIESVPNFV